MTNLGTRGRQAASCCLLGLTLGCLGAPASAQRSVPAGFEADVRGASLPDAPSATLLASTGSGMVSGFAGTGQEPALRTGQVSGKVIDGQAAAIPGANVVLVRNGDPATRQSTTDENGAFHFANVPAGSFRVIASFKGMAPGSFSGVLQAGDTVQTLPIRLDFAAVDSSVTVTASQKDLAEAELHVEEHQRLLGIMPNFFVTYDWNAAPLTTRQKFVLAWKNSIDPGNFFVSGVVAGIQQAQNTFPGYSQGVAGYARRYGAATGDLVSGTYLGGAIFPTLFRQDPRYFYKGFGSIKSRIFYALSRGLICRGDNGRDQFNYSGILGDYAAGAVSNLYYPPGSREGVALTFEEGSLNILGDAVGNIWQEFALKHITPHAPVYASTSNPPTKAMQTP